tara:strand:+ start:250 stop:444 length:195 start_codon:yes stop_codon:yes gene_type:complete
VKHTKNKKYMAGGGKMKKYMAGGGKMKKYMAGGGATKEPKVEAYKDYVQRMFGGGVPALKRNKK